MLGLEPVLQQPLIEEAHLPPLILCCSRFTEIARFILQVPENVCRSGVRVAAEVISRWTGAGERTARVTLLGSSVAFVGACLVLLATGNRWNGADQGMLVTGLFIPFVANSIPAGVACDRRINYSDNLVIQLSKILLKINVLSSVIHSILWVANFPVLRISNFDSNLSSISFIVPLVSSVVVTLANAAAIEFVLSRPPPVRPIPVP